MKNFTCLALQDLEHEGISPIQLGYREKIKGGHICIYMDDIDIGDNDDIDSGASIPAMY